MKDKVLIIGIPLIVICILLAIIYGSSAAASNRENVYGRYILINKLGNGIEGYSRLVYDKDTYVMYIFNSNGVSPYYIVKNDKAEIAIYNVNWFNGVGTYE